MIPKDRALLKQKLVKQYISPGEQKPIPKENIPLPILGT